MLPLHDALPIFSFTTASGKSGRRATFTKVSAVQPQSPVLDRRIASRLCYVREGWHRPITNKERQEYRAEANAALIRAGQFEVRAEQGATRSAERRVGKEWVSTCKSRGAPEQ